MNAGEPAEEPADAIDRTGPVVWIFGYGSLVDPDSMARTIGRRAALGVDFFRAELSGYRRRWNYGVLHLRAQWTRVDGVHVEEGTIVALGLEPSAGGRVNGVIASVAGGELVNLDRRERHYDRVDVTDAVTVLAGSRSAASGPIYTYVPTDRAVRGYESARDEGTAGIRRTYWDLVDSAFARFGPDDVGRYRMTPPPDVPIVDVVTARDR